MDDRELQRNISRVIMRAFTGKQGKSESKLADMQKLYEVKRLCFRDDVSEMSKGLTKKIFGTAIRCIRKTAQFPSCPSLVALGYVLLDIVFKDEYVLNLLIEQLLKNSQNFIKMLALSNPYKKIKINGEKMQKILIQIILKINSWRSIFSMNDILRDYYLASEMFSLFLRMILVKVGYKDADNLTKNLQNTEEIFSILCDYFDLNVIAHRANMLKKNNNVGGADQPLSDQSQVYLFSNYNLFISTADNKQFCCGRYYANQTDLLAGEKQIRKSTLEFIIKCKQANEEEMREEYEEKMDRLQIQMELDLGMSTSGIVSSTQGETPYFNSNAGTPQFGQLLDSARFRKSIDFQTALKMADKAQDKLRTVEEEIQSPVSDGGGDRNLKQSHSKLFCKNKELDQSLNFEAHEIPQAKVQSTTKGEQEDYSKPRSPPSIESYQKEQQVNQPVSLKNWQNSRELTFQNNNKQSQNMSSIETERYKMQNFDFNKRSSNIEMEQNRLVIPVMGKKSLMENNSDMRSESKVQNFDYERGYKQFVNMSVKESQHFAVKTEDIDLSSIKKRDLKARKYSAYETFTNELKELKDKSKNNVHYSNHFKPADEDEPMGRSRKTENCGANRKDMGAAWENTRSDNLAVVKQRESPRKMGFISNVISLQLDSKDKGSPKVKPFKQFKRDKFALMYNLQLGSLRKSKSTKNQKSPRLQNQLHIKAGQPQMGTNSQSPKLHKYASDYLVSTVNTRQFTKAVKKTSGQIKVRKFPEFLRKSKSRKLLIENSEDIIVNQQKYTRRVTEQKCDKDFKDSNIDYVKIELPSTFNRIINKNPKNIQEPILQQQKKTQQQISQQQFQSKSKHTKSQPQLPLFQDSPNKGLLKFDKLIDGRPWQFFGQNNSNNVPQLRFQQKFTQQQQPRSIHEASYLSRQSCSSNEAYQRKYFENIQPPIQQFHQQFIPMHTISSDRIRNDIKTFTDQPMYSTNDNFYQQGHTYNKIGSYPTRVIPQEQQQRYHTIPYNTQPQQQYPLYNPQPHFHLSQPNPNPPKPSPTSLTTPPRQKYPTTTSSKVLSTKAESPTYFPSQNQFGARLQQNWKYFARDDGRK